MCKSDMSIASILIFWDHANEEKKTWDINLGQGDKLNKSSAKPIKKKILELSMAAVAIQKEIPTKSFWPRSRKPSLAPLSSSAAELGMKAKINNK